jgi:3-oxoacyl-[acyl-carrier protein] reductase
MKLLGKVAVVTGAGSGFGEGIARLFAREGARVALLDIREDAARRVADEIGTGAIAIGADVSSGPQVAAAVARVADIFGAPDILVNNAAITHRNMPLLDVDEATFDRLLQVNVKSIYLMTHAVVPLMQRNGGGVIVNIGTKGFVNVVSKSLALDLAPMNIRVNGICPVMGETGLLEQFMGMPDTPENRARFIATIPLGRLSRPEDIARATLYLASEDSAFITGVLLPVDGGRSV